MNFKVTIEETGEQYECSAEQHLLAGMVKLGKRGIPSGCHGGGCGVCKVQINEGTYKIKKMSRAYVSYKEEKAGAVLACRVFPQSDIKLSVTGKLKKNVMR